ncbi:unnamed protein product [Phytophthora lilii]|uniref:Unnamed protein product n=1 Tax=Phytophthora lilii TaxID=2077276 RepID=A0A9W6UD55_9STRA|nr:unnamed protein product [Phytophthora lilii]
MSPETDANDHVPLEFLLGARVKYYYPDSSALNRQRRGSKQARQLLQQVLDEDGLNEKVGPSSSIIPQAEFDKPVVLKTLVEAASASRPDEEIIFDHESFQLNFEDNKRSSIRIKTLQERQDEDIKRQQQRVSSFHGYKQDHHYFLDVTGAAARIPHTTSRHLRDTKLSVIKARKEQEDRRTHELLEILQEQKTHTRTALHHHKEFSKTLTRQRDPHDVSTSLLTLDGVSQQENNKSTGKWNEVNRPRASYPFPEPYRKENIKELEHPRRPMLATLNLDAQIVSSSPTQNWSSNAVEFDEDLLSASSNNEENAETGANSEQVRRRLSDRQREVFACDTANGLFLGGGFIAKKANNKYEKKKKLDQMSYNSGNRLSQETSERKFLDTVLDAQSALILPLVEANKPAVRRREASAGHRRPKPHHKPSPHT